jgi:nucleoside-diphosphate-sugar epimerase
MSSEADPGKALVLVTGATGLVGTAVCDILAQAGYRVRRALRTARLPARDDVIVGDIDGETGWDETLDGVASVVHLAARTHVMTRSGADAGEYRRVNVEGTRRLAEKAARAGVRRFVFLSSIKVNGEATPDRPFNENDAPQPQDAYGRTKREAEDVLISIARTHAMEVVVLRSPLVYGPGVKGNFERLMRHIAAGVPLPLGSVDNRRSLIYVGNLAHAILTCLEKPQATGRTYLVSDGHDLSTPDLMKAIARALHVKLRLLSCPVGLIRMTAGCVGKSAEVDRLTQSLRADTTRIRAELGWAPPYSVSEGLDETAQWYHARVNDEARVQEAHRAL